LYIRYAKFDKFHQLYYIPSRNYLNGPNSLCRKMFSVVK